MTEKKIEQFDFFDEKDKLQKDIKDKVLAFLTKCGNNKIEFHIEPIYIRGRGVHNLKLIDIHFTITITS